jgi:hypothetical protein
MSAFVGEFPGAVATVGLVSGWGASGGLGPGFEPTRCGCSGEWLAAEEGCHGFGHRGRIAICIS